MGMLNPRESLNRTHQGGVLIRNREPGLEELRSGVHHYRLHGGKRRRTGPRRGKEMRGFAPVTPPLAGASTGGASPPTEIIDLRQQASRDHLSSSSLAGRTLPRPGFSCTAHPQWGIHLIYEKMRVYAQIAILTQAHYK